MADVFDEEKRSDIMRQVKSEKNKSTELRLIEIFKQNGITGWRRNYPVKGHPDFVFPKQKIAVFVDGCFWHGHRGCKYATIPVNNHDFWQTKISGNVERDKINVAKLNEMGWRVIEIWQCQLKPKNKELTLSNLLTELQNE